jgi:hypothetical protein
MVKIARNGQNRPKWSKSPKMVKIAQTVVHSIEPGRTRLLQFFAFSKAKQASQTTSPSFSTEKADIKFDIDKEQEEMEEREREI